MAEIRDEARKYIEIYKSELFDSVLPFWMKSDLLDREFGGCITSVDREGKQYNTDKSVWFQGRCLWTFSALCARYGERAEWREIADSAKRFLEEHCVDEDGRMFFTVTRDGRPLRKRRYMFSESFWVIGMAEYGAAFDDADALKKAESCFSIMLRLYDEPASDPFKITPKSYSATRDTRAAAVPMVLISSAQVLRRCIPERATHYSQIVRRITDDMLKYHKNDTLGCVLETVGKNGEFIDTPEGRTVNPGHSCENSWFIMNDALYTGDEECFSKALGILDNASALGWDEVHGGILYFIDICGRPCEQLEWDMKLWWVHNEVIIASLLAYARTRDEKYWSLFKKVHDYAFSHFKDEKFGEWYGYLHRDGTVSHTQKGSMWKGPYHLIRCLMLSSELLQTIADGNEAKPIL